MTRPADRSFKGGEGVECYNTGALSFDPIMRLNSEAGWYPEALEMPSRAKLARYKERNLCTFTASDNVEKCEAPPLRLSSLA